MFAGIAQLVERLLAKEKVASSSLVSRSTRDRYRRLSLRLILILDSALKVHFAISKTKDKTEAKNRMKSEDKDKSKIGGEKDMVWN